MSDEAETKALPLARAMFDYHRAEADFSEAICEAGFGKFSRIGGDDYDNSIEFYEVSDDARMNEAAQRIVYDAGFSTAYVNHKDGWETHYNWRHAEGFKVSRGWRRRYVTDPTAMTTRQIGADDPDQRGYYEISYWPDGWGSPHTKDWISRGFMRIVPDPLEPASLTAAQGGE